MTDKLDVYEFGRRLLIAKDLDPVYTILWNHEWDRPEDLHRYLLAYFCFYHVGTAAWIAQDRRWYWNRMRAAAGSKDYPRSSERRHFRAANAVKSVAYLEERGVEDLFAPLTDGPYTADQVISTVKEWVGFGPWIAFKVADMVERLGLAEVDFSGGEMFLFDSPRKGAELMWDWYHPGSDGGDGVGNWAVDALVSTFSQETASPRFDRPFGVQEAETVLCKWLGYTKGKYKIGKDVEEVKHALTQFQKVKLCRDLVDAGRRGGLWG